jgi:hypothetical protein
LSRLHPGDLPQIMLNHEQAHGLLVAGVHPGLFSSLWVAKIPSRI